MGSDVSFDSVFKRNAFSNKDVDEIDYSIHVLGDNYFEYNDAKNNIKIVWDLLDFTVKTI
ncbi:MAG: hypothetical protein LBM96_06610 [Methanobrevibacter sp.]|nr:hypothetical protein [Candidatus Methanoflexus mossambicus]